MQYENYEWKTVNPRINNLDTRIDELWRKDQNSKNEQSFLFTWR